jgi:hypothetical protein
MIEKVIIKRTLKADRFYMPGEVLFPPFTKSIMAEIKAGTDVLEIVQDGKKVQEQKESAPAPVIVMSVDVREILFRKFEPLEVLNRVVYKPRPLRGTSPTWFRGRNAPKKRKILYRQIGKLEG